MSRALTRRVQTATLALVLSGLSLPGFAEDGRYIVKFRAGRSGAGRAALGAAGARIVVWLDPQDAVAARIPERALAGLSRNPNVEYGEVDPVREPMAWSDRPLTSGEVLSFGVQMVQADLVSSVLSERSGGCEVRRHG